MIPVKQQKGESKQGDPACSYTLVWVPDPGRLWWLYRLSASAFVTPCRVDAARLAVADCLGWIDLPSEGEWGWFGEDPAIHHGVCEGYAPTLRAARCAVLERLEAAGVISETPSVVRVIRGLGRDELGAVTPEGRTP